MHTLGKIFVALASLAVTVTPTLAGEAALRSAAAQPTRLADSRAGAVATRMLKPITWGMEQSSPQKALARNLALAPSQSAGVAKAPLRRHGSQAAEIVIDVLVAYTSKAAQHYYEIESEVVETAIEEANRSFRLSGIGHIQLRLAQVVQTGYVEHDGHFEHVWRLADKDDGHMEYIHALREAYRADIAILIVDDPKSCGLATRIGADAGEAFAVVHHECAAANYTLAHEIGHLLGARHEMSYVSGTGWRDIMGYKDACGGCPRLPVWSNPLVLIGGQPAGTAELNNARIIAENAARVAAFR